MKRILVIADDLTGAAEIGAIALGFGLNARIHCGRAAETDAAVQIVDTDTRTCSPGQAAGRLRTLLRHLDAAPFDLIYKKTDSVLRGPIAAELNAILSSLGIPHALLVPQNPSRGRVIVNGVYQINGVPLDHTPLAHDPEHPAKSALVTDLLGPMDAVHIGDGASIPDLERWARSLDPSTLPAGGADFFQAILRTRGSTEILLPPCAGDGGPMLMVCGSAVKPSRDFVQATAQTAGWVSPMPRILFDSEPADPAAIEQWAKDIGDHLRESGRAMIAVPHPPAAERAPRVRHAVAEVVARVLKIHQPGTLFIEGGATAAAIAQRMDWKMFDVAGQISPGVVGVRTISPPRQFLVIKPGSYPWPSDLFR